MRVWDLHADLRTEFLPQVPMSQMVAWQPIWWQKGWFWGPLGFRAQLAHPWAQGWVPWGRAPELREKWHGVGGRLNDSFGGLWRETFYQTRTHTPEDPKGSADSPAPYVAIPLFHRPLCGHNFYESTALVWPHPYCTAPMWPYCSSTAPVWPNPYSTASVQPYP